MDVQARIIIEAHTKEELNELNNIILRRNESSSISPTAQEMCTYFTQGKIAAVKAHKERTGCSLIESKKQFDVFDVAKEANKQKIINDTTAIETTKAIQIERKLQSLRQTIYYNKTKSPRELGRLMGIEIIDPDGWREDGVSFADNIELSDFLARADKSTVDNNELYKQV